MDALGQTGIHHIRYGVNEIITTSKIKRYICNLLGIKPETKYKISLRFIANEPYIFTIGDTILGGKYEITDIVDTSIFAKSRDFLYTSEILLIFLYDRIKPDKINN